METLLDSLNGKSGVRFWNRKGIIFSMPFKTFTATCYPYMSLEDYEKIFYLPSLQEANSDPDASLSLKVIEDKNCISLHDLSTHQTTRTAYLLYTSGYIKVINGCDFKRGL